MTRELFLILGNGYQWVSWSRHCGEGRRMDAGKGKRRKEKARRLYLLSSVLCDPIALLEKGM